MRFRSARNVVRDQVEVCLADVSSSSCLRLRGDRVFAFAGGRSVALLERIGRILRPDGLLLLTTCLQGGSLGTEALNLWGSPPTAPGGDQPKTNSATSHARPATVGKR